MCWTHDQLAKHRVCRVHLPTLPCCSARNDRTRKKRTCLRWWCSTESSNSPRRAAPANVASPVHPVVLVRTVVTAATVNPVTLAFPVIPFHSDPSTSNNSRINVRANQRPDPMANKELRDTRVHQVTLESWVPTVSQDHKAQLACLDDLVPMGCLVNVVLLVNLVRSIKKRSEIQANRVRTEIQAFLVLPVTKVRPDKTVTTVHLVTKDNLDDLGNQAPMAVLVKSVNLETSVMKDHVTTVRPLDWHLDTKQLSLQYIRLHLLDSGTINCFLNTLVCSIILHPTFSFS